MRNHGLSSAAVVQDTFNTFNFPIRFHPPCPLGPKWHVCALSAEAAEAAEEGWTCRRTRAPLSHRLSGTFLRKHESFAADDLAVVEGRVGPIAIGASFHINADSLFRISMIAASPSEIHLPSIPSFEPRILHLSTRESGKTEFAILDSKYLFSWSPEAEADGSRLRSVRPYTNVQHTFNRKWNSRGGCRHGLRCLNLAF